jgi:hypothetical protein
MDLFFWKLSTKSRSPFPAMVLRVGRRLLLTTVPSTWAVAKATRTDRHDQKRLRIALSVSWVEFDFAGFLTYAWTRKSIQATSPGCWERYFIVDSISRLKCSQRRCGAHLVHALHVLGQNDSRVRDAFVGPQAVANVEVGHGSPVCSYRRFVAHLIHVLPVFHQNNGRVQGAAVGQQASVV